MQLWRDLTTHLDQQLHCRRNHSRCIGLSWGAAEPHIVQRPQSAIVSVLQASFACDVQYDGDLALELTQVPLLIILSHFEVIGAFLCGKSICKATQTFISCSTERSIQQSKHAIQAPERHIDHANQEASVNEKQLTQSSDLFMRGCAGTEKFPGRAFSWADERTLRRNQQCGTTHTSDECIPPRTALLICRRSLRCGHRQAPRSCYRPSSRRPAMADACNRRQRRL